MRAAISRRDFLKISTAFGGFALLHPAGALGAALPERGGETTEWVPSICNFCSSVCDIRVQVHRRNGAERLVKIDGNPRSPLNRGKVCARGQSGLLQVYDPDRIKQPLIRVEGSKRGEWKFRAATWEEAYAYIVEKLKKVKPWEIALVSGWQYCVSYMQFSLPFIRTLGIPNIVGSPLQHCVAAGHFGTDLVTGNFNVHDEILADFENARYILFSLNNASVAGISTSRAVRFGEAKRRGARVVCLDPRLSELAAKADEWVPIKPGTDMAFFLAVLHVVLKKELYEKDFVAQHTNAPFLAYRDPDGQVRLVEDARSGKATAYYVYDAVRSRISAVPAFANTNTRSLRGERLVPALRVPRGLRHRVDGRDVPVRTVFEFLEEAVESYTPEWAAKVTEIPAETIERIATEFGLSRPALVDPGWMGARYHHLIPLRRVQAVLQTLVGGIDRPGGWIMGGEYRHKVKAFWERHRKGKPQPSNPAELPGLRSVLGMNALFGSPGAWPHKHPGFSWVWAEQQQGEGGFGAAWPLMADTGLLEAVQGKLTFRGEPYRIKAIFLNAANPVRHYFPAQRWREILSSENVELVVAVDVLPSDSTPYADVILPNHTYLERDEPVVYPTGPAPDLAFATRFRAIQPLYDSRDSAEIMYRIAKGLGKGDVFLDAVARFSGWNAAELKARVHQAEKEGKPINHLFLKASFEGLSRYAEEVTGVKKSPEEIERTLRTDGVLVLQGKHELLEEAAMPWKIPVPTLSGRLELYSLVLAGFVDRWGYRPEWDPVVRFVSPDVFGPKRVHVELGPDEFYFTYGKIPIVSHASTNNNNPLLDAIRRTKPEIFEALWIHAGRARKLGLRTGDHVEVENVRDGFRVRARIFATEAIRPDTVFLPSSYGSRNPNLHVAAGRGTPLSELIPYRLEPVAASFASQEFTVRIRKI